MPLFPQLLDIEFPLGDGVEARARIALAPTFLATDTSAPTARRRSCKWQTAGNVAAKSTRSEMQGGTNELGQHGWRREFFRIWPGLRGGSKAREGIPQEQFRFGQFARPWQLFCHKRGDCRIGERRIEKDGSEGPTPSD